MDAGACLVAVVAVGDDELLVCHFSDHEADDGGIVHAPEAVDHSVFVGHFGICGAGAVKQDLLHAGRGVGVEHEDLPEVCPRGPEQVQAVGLWF